MALGRLLLIALTGIYLSASVCEDVQDTHEPAEIRITNLKECLRVANLFLRVVKEKYSFQKDFTDGVFDPNQLQPLTMVDAPTLGQGVELLSGQDRVEVRSLVNVQGGFEGVRVTFRAQGKIAGVVDLRVPEAGFEIDYAADAVREGRSSGGETPSRGRVTVTWENPGSQTSQRYRITSLRDVVVAAHKALNEPSTSLSRDPVLEKPARIYGTTALSYFFGKNPRLTREPTRMRLGDYRDSVLLLEYAPNFWQYATAGAVTTPRKIVMEFKMMKQTWRAVRQKALASEVLTELLTEATKLKEKEGSEAVELVVKDVEAGEHVNALRELGFNEMKVVGQRNSNYVLSI